MTAYHVQLAVHLVEEKEVQQMQVQVSQCHLMVLLQPVQGEYLYLLLILQLHLLSQMKFFLGKFSCGRERSPITYFLNKTTFEYTQFIFTLFLW